MRVYRGCLFGFFALIILSLSLVLSRSFGLLGLVLPPALVLFTYVWVDSFIAELIAWSEERHS